MLYYISISYNQNPNWDLTQFEFITFVHLINNNKFNFYFALYISREMHLKII